MKRQIQVRLDEELYQRVSAQAKAAHQSRNSWMVVAALEKLGRFDLQKAEAQPARPVEGEGKGDAA